MASQLKTARLIAALSLVGVIGLTAYHYFAYGEFNWLPLLSVLIAAGVVFGFFGDLVEEEDGSDAR